MKYQPAQKLLITPRIHAHHNEKTPNVRVGALPGLGVAHGLLVVPEGHQNPHLRTLGIFDSLEFNFEAQFRLETRGLVQGPDL